MPHVERVETGETEGTDEMAEAEAGEKLKGARARAAEDPMRMRAKSELSLTDLCPPIDDAEPSPSGVR